MCNFHQHIKPVVGRYVFPGSRSQAIHLEVKSIRAEMPRFFPLYLVQYDGDVCVYHTGKILEDLVAKFFSKEECKGRILLFLNFYQYFLSLTYSEF